MENRMSYEKKDNEGSIWKNDKKTQDTHADFNGTAIIEGVEYWVNAWKRSPDANPKAPALKFRFKAKEEVHNNGKQRTEQTLLSNGQGFDDFESDSIPF